MRAFLAIAGLIAVALVVAVAIAFFRPNSSSTPPAEVEPEPVSKPTTKTKTQPGAATPTAAQPGSDRMMTFDEAKAGAVRARIVVDGRGTIGVELYPKAAPKTVEHFLSLCKQHFYDGILVHRVEPDPAFQLFQAGDPASKQVDPKQLQGKTTAQVASEFQLGGGGSGASVPLEARLPNVAYSLGLARSADPNSGDSQFYVNLSNNNALDGQYCVFGRVVEGQDVAAKVQIGDRIHTVSAP